MSGADNQQERPIEFRGWVLGFVDAEGCFSIGFVRQPTTSTRKGYGTGYQVTHRFSVTQGISGVRCLEELKEFFGVGRVVRNQRHDNHREDLCQYVVNRREDLMEAVIPFFHRYPLLTAKRRDFEKFARCVELMSSGHHLTAGGLIEIAEIVETMNRRVSRQELIGILRGQTPATSSEVK
jgi:LAGLIDADG endonuclease